MKEKINSFFNIVGLVFGLVITQTFYKIRFGAIGRKTILFGRFTSLTHPECVFIGDRVRILKNARLDCITSWMGDNFQPSLVVGSNVNIGQNFFVSCASDIFIDDGVLISDNVAIVDTNHMCEEGLSCSETPITTNKVTIERNVVIYRNVTILSGSHIEEGAIVGANSVVKGRVLKNSLAVGSPAKMVNRGA